MFQTFVLNWYSFLFFGEYSIYTCRYIKTWILIILKPGTQDKERKKTTTKNTICIGHHYTQTKTNNVNKTWALLQTTGGKDKPNIVFMQKS
jgi:hypothetical protein